jgi:hypothetical protein
MSFRILPSLCLVMIIFSSCTGTPSVTSTPLPTTQIPTSTESSSPTQVQKLEASPIASATPAPAQLEPTPTITVMPTLGPRPTLGQDDWKQVPVVPEDVSQRVRLIYQLGLMAGNDPHAFSKVGDCNATNPYFLTDFDTPGSYNLGEYEDLQDTIDYFSGSYSRASLAAKEGLTAHAVLSVLWNTWKECDSYETPLTCEYRIHKPMYSIIAFGTNDAHGTVDFEKALRRVIDMTIGNGTIPILATKADNAEGYQSFNRLIVDMANEYELPVWNYWLAVQSIPGKGLLDKQHREHLSVGPDGLFNFETDNLPYGWSIRNLTALEVLDTIRRDVEK